METPQLRLLLLAYLRGLIRPDYEHGVRSQIREMLVLNAVAREEEGNTYQARALLDAVILPNLNQEARTEGLRRSVTSMDRATSLKSQHSFKIARQIGSDDQKLKSRREMIAALKLLNSTDFKDKMRRIARA